jgi:HEPN domain-containing protein
MLGSDGPYDTACFHAQQPTEKALKGFLAFHGQVIPRTHDLEELQRVCLRIEPGLDFDDLDLAELTDYAVELRYDFDFWPDRASAAAVVARAERACGMVIAALPEPARPR